MPKKFTDEEYYKTLPRKQVGTAVLFFNVQGELLILKPDYKNSWLVPGGSNDEGESPLRCAIRETKEEIGLDISELRLVGVYHSPQNGIAPDSLKFIFDGGILAEDQIEKIVLQKEEFEEYMFKDSTEAISLLSSSLRKSVPGCLNAIQENSCMYLDGQ